MSRFITAGELRKALEGVNPTAKVLVGQGSTGLFIGRPVLAEAISAETFGISCEEATDEDQHVESDQAVAS